MTVANFAGYHVVVTGAAHGAGRAIAAELHHRGARVSITDIDARALRRTARRLGLGVRAVALDIGDPGALAGFVDLAHAAHGPVDVLVNATSAAPAHCTRLVIADMIDRGAGHVVNIATAANAPAAVRATDAARAEFGNAGVRFTCVVTGSLAETGSPGSRFRLNRTVEPAEVARAVSLAIAKQTRTVHVPRRLRPMLLGRRAGAPARPAAAGTQGADSVDRPPVVTHS